MSTNRKYYIVMIVATVIALVFNVASDDRALLLVQKRLGIPARPLRIGSAEFETSDRWLLIASRESPDQSVRLFGMFPSWFAIKPFTAPPERFYLFRLVGDPDRATVTLFEENAHTINNVAEIIARSSLKKDAVAASSPKRRTFRGHDALEWRFSSGSMIYIPGLRVTILMEPASSIAEVGISVAEPK
jgi:hypothetical protein